jgi:hypothetical protein
MTASTKSTNSNQTSAGKSLSPGEIVVAVLVDVVVNVVSAFILFYLQPQNILGEAVPTPLPPISTPIASPLPTAHPEPSALPTWNSGVGKAHCSDSSMLLEPTPTISVPSNLTTSLSIPGEGSRYFPETGKTIRGIFLEYWTRYGALIQHGFPISDLLVEASDLDGKLYTVQYFERSVFEYHLENSAPYNVQLSQLGALQFKARYPTGYADAGSTFLEPTSQVSQFFPETGHKVDGKFLQYWQAHGGVAYLGFPISEPFLEKSDLDGEFYKVQYFERTVLEEHPEKPAPYDVLQAQLGALRYRKNCNGRDLF